MLWLCKKAIFQKQTRWNLCFIGNFANYCNKCQCTVIFRTLQIKWFILSKNNNRTIINEWVNRYRTNIILIVDSKKMFIVFYVLLSKHSWKRSFKNIFIWSTIRFIKQKKNQLTWRAFWRRRPFELRRFWEFKSWL